MQQEYNRSFIPAHMLSFFWSAVQFDTYGSVLGRIWAFHQWHQHCGSVHHECKESQHEWQLFIQPEENGNKPHQEIKKVREFVRIMRTAGFFLCFDSRKQTQRHKIMALRPRKALLIPFVESVYPGISYIPAYCEPGLGRPTVAPHHADENNSF